MQPRGGYENSHHRGGYNNGPNMVHGMPYGDHPPFYPRHPPSNSFAPPFIINGQPMYGNPHSPGLPNTHPPPGTFPSNVNNGPFIVGGQPMYSPHPPACWAETYQQGNGYYSPPFHMPNYSDGYFNSDQDYNEPYPQNVDHLTVPHNSNKITPPPSTIVTVKEDDRSSTSAETVTTDEPDKKPRANESFDPEGDTEIESEKKTDNKAEAKTETKTKPEEDIFKLRDHERPKLIRVHDSDTGDEETDDDKETSLSVPEAKSKPKSEPESKYKSTKPPRPVPALAKVAKEVDGDHTTPEPTSEFDTTPETTPDKKKEKAPRTDNMPDECYDLNNRVSNSSPQTCTHRFIDEEYQLRTGKTIGEYIRKGVEDLHGDYPKELVEVVAREIAAEEQEKEKKRKEQQD